MQALSHAVIDANIERGSMMVPAEPSALRQHPAGNTSVYINVGAVVGAVGAFVGAGGTDGQRYPMVSVLGTASGGGGGAAESTLQPQNAPTQSWAQSVPVQPRAHSSPSQ